MNEDRKRLEEALRATLSGRLCVSAWLGYGQPLFLGFGPHVIAAHDSDGKRSLPPAEIQTSMADWRVGLVTGEDEPAVARAAIESLIGLSVDSWTLTEIGDLQVTFTEGKTLELVCSGEPDLDEWWVWRPESGCIGIGPGRKVFARNR